MEQSIRPARLTFALKALGTHFAASCVLALAIVGIVFFYWIPEPYYDLVRVSKLFLVLLAVDVVCGPLLTAILATPAKSHRELWLDFSLVILLQLGALAYGLHTIANLRPVALVFEVDRFVVISTSQINIGDLAQAPTDLQQLPWNGPQLKGVRGSRNIEETLQSIEQSLQGLEPSARPSWWQSYELSRPQVRQRMKSIASLYQQASFDQRQVIGETILALPQSLDQTFYLPLVYGNQLDSWIVLLDGQANIIGYAPVGGF